jgi:hypothetical protein
MAESTFSPMARGNPSEVPPLPSSLTPAERVLRSQIGAHKSWAQTDDRSARTAPARRAANDRFENQVDPDRILAPEERARRAEHARKAHMLSLALKSARARRQRKERVVNRDVAATGRGEGGNSAA